MEGLKDFPDDFSQPFEISLNYLNSCHIRYFRDNISLYQKYWRFIIMTVIEFINLIAMWMFIFRTIGSQVINLPDMALTAVAAVIGLQSILKATVLLPKTKEVEVLMKGIAMAWKTENLSHIQIKIKKQRIKVLNFGLSVFKWGCQFGILQNLAPQLIYTVLGKCRHEDFNFILPFGCVYPFDPVKNWGRYLLVYALQSYSILHLIYYYLGAGSLLVTLSSQLSTAFALLREDIKMAVPMPNSDKRTDNTIVDKNMTLETMVKNHQELIKLAQSLNYIFNRMIFIDLCFFAVIICFFAILLAISQDVIDKFANMTSIFAMLTMVYLFCYYCEMLKQESAGIADSAYENPWYEGGTHYQKTISFIILRAQLPCYVTSLNYSPITLNTFTKVVSTTWSYFSLMMTIYGDN